MSYKVNFYTLAKMEDGRTGNIKQSSEVCYTDLKIDQIQIHLDKYLEQKKRVAVIERIEDVKGFCLIS